MKKRILSILLLICMTFSLMPSVVYADDTSNEVQDGSATLRDEWLKFKENEAEKNDQKINQNLFSSTTVSTVNNGSPTLMFGQNQQSTDVNRYTVLVLDVSGSMGGTPITTLKAAAKKFCEKVLQAEGNNYVAIISYASQEKTVCNFTSNLTTLQNSIDNIYASGSTNMNSGLQAADNLLSAIPDAQGTIKNVLLLSDGMPNRGLYSNSGPYSYSDYYYYDYANAVYNTAATLKNKGYYLYTLGFFHSLWDEELAFARKFMNDLQNAGYYDVVNADDLEFVFGEIAQKILKKTGTFNYQSGDNDYQATYYYDDAYFSNNSYTYNESLATMSLCLAMSAFATSADVPYTLKSANVLNLLEQTGFADFSTNYWYTVKPTKDSIGVVAANKQIEVNKKPYTLIAVAVRGGGYESEWASNFTIGETGQHQGFNEAKNNVLGFIRDYIAEKGITGDIKLWLTGYSRAGATSNLVAGAIDDGSSLGNCTLNLSDLYAYCFEPPAGAIAPDANKNAVYKNIFNIVNYNDPVPKVAPAVMGFRRYGTDKRLPTSEIDNEYLAKRAKMVEKYDALPSISTTGSRYIVDDFDMKKISVDVHYFPNLSIEPTIISDTKNKKSQGIFLDDFIIKMVKEQIKSRSNYVDKYQDGIRETFGVLYGTEDEQWANFKQIFENKLKSNIGTLVVSTSSVGQKIVGSTSDLIEQYAVESLNEAGITNYNADQIHKLAETMASTIIEFAASHPNLTTTLICNIKGIAAAHYPELCLAWLQSMDKNYTTDAGEAFSNGAYRIIRINCPVDVEVYDTNGNIVAAIKSDEPQNIEKSSIVSAINEDGEKLVYLPADTDYNIELVSTGSDRMTYSVNEFSRDIGDIDRIVNYNDIAIKPGDTFESKIPAFSSTDLQDVTGNGSSTAYALFDAGNALIPPSTDLKGTEATEAFYMVSVSSNNDEYGSVTGQGIRQLGNYAKVIATPFEGCKFEGWYIDDKKISSEPEYRFRVESDVELVAKFTKNSPPDVSKAVASVPVVWPPNNKMTEIKISGVVDPDGDPVSITITGITQNEPLTNDKEGDAYGIGTDSAWVRASRNGTGSGRIYRISFKASDDKGAESQGIVCVWVPHDQKKGTSIIDDGKVYNSVVK